MLNEYQRIIRHKSKLIRSGARRSDILAWNELLSSRIAWLSLFRDKFITSLQPILERESARLFNHKVSISINYRPAIRLKPGLINQERELVAYIKNWLANRTDDELNRKKLLAGSHLDNYELTISGNQPLLTPSSGQYKLIFYALLFSVTELTSNHGTSNIVYLLDDVLNELDQASAKRLTKRISELSAQVFITGNRQAGLNFEKANRYQLVAGDLIEN